MRKMVTKLLALFCAAYFLLLPRAFAEEQAAELASYEYQNKVLTVLNDKTDKVICPDGILEIVIAEQAQKAFRLENGMLIDIREDSVIAAITTLEEAIIPQGIRRIGGGTFSGNRVLASVRLPGGLETVGAAAFSGCSALEEIVFPDSTYEIGGSTFSWCESLRRCVLPSAVQELSDSMFWGCISLEQVFLPTKLKKIGHDAFFACHSLKQLQIPKTVTFIDCCAFSNCYSLTSLIIPADVQLGVSLDAPCGIFDNSGIRILVFESDETNITNMVFSQENHGNFDWGIDVANIVFKMGPPKEYDIEQFEWLRELEAIHYTAKYAQYWAPNGETEWNGFPIEVIDEAGIEALIAEAEASVITPTQTVEPMPEPTVETTEAMPTPVCTPSPTATPPAAEEESNLGSTVLVVVTMLGVAIVAVAIGLIVRRKKKRSE